MNYRYAYMVCAEDSANSVAADESLAAVETIRQTIDTIFGTIFQVAEVVDTLSRDSQKVNDSLVTIKDIAEQTNLLALNVSIEAARFGNSSSFASLNKPHAQVHSSVHLALERADQDWEFSQEIRDSIVAAMRAEDGSEQVMYWVNKLTGERLSEIHDQIAKIAKK